MHPHPHPITSANFCHTNHTTNGRYGVTGLGIDDVGGIVINNGMNSHTDLRRYDLPTNYTRPTEARQWADAVR
jgi:hypothetical protein